MSAASASDARVAAALLVACCGIATYAFMDGVMKGLTLAVGVYTAMFWRMAAGTVLTAALYLASRPTVPAPAVIRVHAARSVVVTAMALAFFWGIARTPLAEAVALTFIAPLIALALAAMVLKEHVGARAVLGSLLGLAGVAVILAGRLGQTHGRDALAGAAAVLVSAVLYAINLVMARHQAQLARPLEIAFFQNGFVLLVLATAAPWWLALPVGAQWAGVGAAAGLAVVSLLLMSWAYARAEAPVLLVVEYTAFVWAALCGWLFFAEPLTLLTLMGTVLIVAGCLLAARVGGGPALPEAEAAA